MDRPRKEIVVPGKVLTSGDRRMKAGFGTFRRGDEVVANIVGLENPKGGTMNLIPLAGRYIPRPHKHDLVIGIVVETAQSYWNVDINSPYTAMLHVNDTPWKIDYGMTVNYLDIGDALIARVSEVGNLRRVFLTIKDKGLRRLDSGHIIMMSPCKVARVIGKRGSMLQLLKEKTRCRIFVGQNGRIWAQGAHEDIVRLERALRMIETMSHMPGLTTRVERFLDEVAEGASGDDADGGPAVRGTREDPAVGQGTYGLDTRPTPVRTPGDGSTGPATYTPVTPTRAGRGPEGPGEAGGPAGPAESDDDRADAGPAEPAGTGWPATREATPAYTADVRPGDDRTHITVREARPEDDEGERPLPGGTADVPGGDGPAPTPGSVEQVKPVITEGDFMAWAGRAGDVTPPKDGVPPPEEADGPGPDDGMTVPGTGIRLRIYGETEETEEGD